VKIYEIESLTLYKVVCKREMPKGPRPEGGGSSIIGEGRVRLNNGGERPGRNCGLGVDGATEEVGEKGGRR